MQSPRDMLRCQDCIRCGKPLTPESLVLLKSLPDLDGDSRSVWHYRHSNPCRWEYHSLRFIEGARMRGSPR